MSKKSKIDTNTVIYLIDNSYTSINGDYPPNRLEAQKLAAESHAHYVLSLTNKSHVSCATYGEGECGFRSSFTNDLTRFKQSILQISTAGKPLLKKCIDSATLAMKHSPNPTSQKNIIVFISTSPDITNEESASAFQRAKKYQIHIHFVLLSEETEQTRFLKDLTEEYKTDFIKVPPQRAVGDCLLLSRLGPGFDKKKTTLNEFVTQGYCAFAELLGGPRVNGEYPEIKLDAMQQQEAKKTKRRGKKK